MAAYLLPFELIAFLLLSDSDDIRVQLVIFFDKPFIFALKRNQSLRVELLIMLLQLDLVLQLLVALRRLQQVLEEFLHELRALLICKRQLISQVMVIYNE